MTIDRADFPDDARERWLAWQDDMLLRWRRFAYFKSAPRGEVDDLVQEAMLRTFGKHLKEPFTAKDDAIRYGATVLKNVLFDWQHRDGRRYEVPLDDAAETIVDLSPTPDEIVADRDLRRLLRSAIDDLPPKYRDAIRARLSGLTYAEAATLFGITPSHFGVVLHHAMNRLKVKLASLLTQYVPTPILSWPILRKVRAVVVGSDATNARHGVVASLVAALAVAGPAAQSAAPQEVPRVPRHAVSAAPPDARNRGKGLPIAKIRALKDEVLAQDPVVATHVVLPDACADLQPMAIGLPACGIVRKPPGTPPTEPPIEWTPIRVPEPVDGASWEESEVAFDPPPTGAAPAGSPSLPVVPIGG